VESSKRWEIDQSLFHMLAAFRHVPQRTIVRAVRCNVSLQASSAVVYNRYIASALDSSSDSGFGPSKPVCYGTKRHYSSSRISGATHKSDGFSSLDDLPSRGVAQLTTKRRLRDILIATRSIQALADDFTFSLDGTVREAISRLATKKLGASMVVDKKGQVAGMFTARDIIRFIHENRTKKCVEKVLDSKIDALYTPKDKVIFCSPDDSVRHCREIMFQHKIRHIPVIEDGNILGVINGGELSDSTFSLESAGGKKAFMKNVLGRLGLPEGTRASRETRSGSENEESGSASSILEATRYGITTSEYALPHPYKSKDRVAGGRRDYGPGDLCSDSSLSEDAHVSLTVPGAADGRESGEQVYMVVADGVGSWRQYGIDPRKYAHKLVAEARRVIESDALQRKLISEQSDGDMALFVSEPIHPLDVIVDAWSATAREEITGSCTICVASMDNVLNQLTVSNLGDCGLMIIRHMDSETIGYLRERSTPRHMRKSDLKIAFISQQQLRSFNLPYQLGFSGIPEHQGTFERPSDATTFSVPVLPGDVVILATDGLFDNLELDEIVGEVAKWEDKWFGKLYLKDEHPEHEKSCMNALAKQLVDRSRELSLLKDKDSPFALLAKDNDIMWSGGMPDDTTVVCARMFIPLVQKEKQCNV